MYRLRDSEQEKEREENRKTLTCAHRRYTVFTTSPIHIEMLVSQNISLIFQTASSR